MARLGGVGFRPNWYQNDEPIFRDPGTWFSVRRLLRSAAVTLVAITIAAYVLELMAANVLGWPVEAWLGLNTAWVADSPLLFSYQFVSYLFVHLLRSPLHILFNLIVLYFFGTQLEGMIGKRAFLRIFFVAGVFGGFCQFLSCVLSGVHSQVVGDSGAVMGVLVAYATLAPGARTMLLLFPFFVPIKARTLAWILVGLDLFTVLFFGGHSQKAVFAHLGGALSGWVLLGGAPAWRRWSGRARAWQERESGRRREESRRRVDDLLEKINREGISELSEAERRFLRRASRDFASRDRGGRG